MINYEDYIQLRDSGHVKLLWKNASFHLEVKQAHPITGAPLESLVERTNPPDVLTKIAEEVKGEVEKQKKVIAGLEALIADENTILEENEKANQPVVSND